MGSAWRRLWPIRFYRSEVCYSQHASHAWYFEWRGRGWSIEVTPIGPHLWKPDLDALALVTACRSIGVEKNDALPIIRAAFDDQTKLVPFAELDGALT